MRNNAYSAAKFLVDLYCSTGAVSYLPDNCYHCRESVIETLMLAYMNKDIFSRKGERWPWNELKIAIMHRCDWGDWNRNEESYHTLYIRSAGRLLTRKVRDINMDMAANAIVNSVRASTATDELSKVLHDLRVAEFSVTQRYANTDRMKGAYGREFSLLFTERTATNHAEIFNRQLNEALNKEPDELFCIEGFADRYCDAFKLKVELLLKAQLA